jgi:glutaconate CoA-transferase subunit B
VFVIMRQSRRSFVDQIDFRTSPGNAAGPDDVRARIDQRWLGRGPSVVVTDLGIYRFGEDGQMRLESLHPGATIEGVRDTIGWDIKVAPTLATTQEPTERELQLIRVELDPAGAYTK